MNKKVVFLPYDMDTALGINNEGSLTFDYGLEDVDQVNGANVFNGQNSVLWNNLRDAFGPEIATMYKNLRAEGTLSYANVEARFENHQSKWPEAIFNEDAKFKYIDPLTDTGTTAYLEMLLGSKTEQRKWWLYNRFRYMDSKWNAGDALSDIITIRGYAKSNITVTPYADIYPTVKYGSYVVSQRGHRDTQYTLVCPLDELDDTEIYIYSASQLASIGDVSGLLPGYCDFSNAVRLQHLKIGSNASGYSNPKLEHLSIGSLPLLQDIDVRNCPNLTETVDLSGCVNLEEANFAGTGVTGVQLANGGAIETLVLPNTITNLTLRNLTHLQTLTVAGYSNITTLWLEGNSSAVNTLNIFNSIATGARVRILGIQWSISNWSTFFARLKSMRGLDESGNNTDLPQLSGSIYTSTISSGDLAYMRENFPNVTMTYTTLQSTVYYYNEDGSSLYQTKSVSNGGTAPSYTPTKASTPQYTYTFAGWSLTPGGAVASNALTNVTADRNVYAVFNATVRKYTVYFYNENTLLQTVQNVSYGGSATYTGSTPTKSGYEFTGWSPSPTNITQNTSCYAQFQLDQMEVEEIADSWATIIARAEAGTASQYYKVGNYKPLVIGSETINYQIIGIEKDDLADNSGKAGLTFMPMTTVGANRRWNPELGYGTKTTEAFTASGDVWTSQNRYKISTARATWTLTATEPGTISVAYKTSNANASRNTITSLTINNASVVTNYANTAGGTYSVEVAAGDTVTVDVVYDLKNASYNYYATITFSGASFTTNASVGTADTRDTTVFIDGTGGVGGWEHSEMRAYLNGDFFNSIPSEVRTHIKSVTKKQQSYSTSGTAVAQTTSDKVWLPSYHEVRFGTLTGEGNDVMQYSASVFPDAASRIRSNTSGTAQYWWLRSAYGTSYVFYVYPNGTNYYTGAYTTGAVCPSFCV